MNQIDHFSSAWHLSIRDYYDKRPTEGAPTQWVGGVWYPVRQLGSGHARQVMSGHSFQNPHGMKQMSCSAMLDDLDSGIRHAFSGKVMSKVRYIELGTYPLI